MFYAGKDFESAKEYKTLDGAKKAADKNGWNIYDEDAKRIYPEDPIAAEAKTEEQPEEEPETAEPKEETVSGKIRRVFNGKLRLRRYPSADNDAVCGVTSFTTKEVVKKITASDGVWYQTTDGYFVSGDPANVEFIAAE